MDGVKRAAVLKGAMPSGAVRSRGACVQGATSISLEDDTKGTSSVALLYPGGPDFILEHAHTYGAGGKVCILHAASFARAIRSIRKAFLLSFCLLMAACATVQHSPVSTPPVLEKAMTPVYPPAAIAAGHVGLVLIKVGVRADGKVSSVDLVKRAPFLELEAAAEVPAYFWRFRPAISDGVPAAGTVRIPVSFLRSGNGDLAVVICQALPPSAPDDETTACPTPSPTVHQPVVEQSTAYGRNTVATDIPGSGAPKIANRTPVAYPPEAIRDRHQGTVTLLILVDVNGKPLDIKVSQSSGFRELDLAALQSATQWTFVPEVIKSIPKQGYVRVPVNFSLNYPSEPTDHLPDEVRDSVQGDLAGASQKAVGAFNVEFFDGTLFAGRLDGSKLIESHQKASVRRPDRPAPPATPAAAGAYAANLEKAYSSAYAAATRGKASSYASRCMDECELTLAFYFFDGGNVWVNLQPDAVEIWWLAWEGLPTAADAQVLANAVALMRNHPGWQPSNDSLRAVAGPTVMFAQLYYYDRRLQFVPGGQMHIPPPPPPPPPPSPSDGSTHACKLADQGVGTLEASSSMDKRVTEVAMVIGDSGRAEHEWVTHSSGSKSLDIDALDKAAGWTFEGPGCSHKRMTRLVVVDQPDQGGKR